MSDEKIVVVKGKSNVVGILAIVFAIIGIFFLGIVFVPLALILTIITTIQAIKRREVSSIVIAVVAWILTLATCRVWLGLASM
ncbi:MAG: hypothetical protein GXZ15_02730 [Campylobacter sp.]|nr:hypothetical protein [Campylobacter sp.]